MLPQWNALYVKHNHEKAASKFLAAHGIDHYLPLYSEQSEWSNRRRVAVERPVFPGYLFVRFAPEQRREVLMAPGVVCLTRKSKFGAITGAEIALLRETVEGSPAGRNWNVHIERRLYLGIGATDGQSANGR